MLQGAPHARFARALRERNSGKAIRPTISHRVPNPSSDAVTRQSVEHWKKFFRDHKSYFKVGRVNHPPIDPTSPLPPHCDPKKDAAQRARWGGAEPVDGKDATKAEAMGVEPEPKSGGQAHEEL